MVGRTVVVVAHRLSTIQCADQIVVMDNRKIVDVGTHEELLTGCRRYQDLIKRQSTMMRDVSVGTLQKLLPTDFSIDDE
ncbi:MAG: ABC-type multidrug transport system fused ATPase/permease subunit [Bacillariaceae sp.]|jgi:ATP-binding cassette subfamily B protein